MSVKSLMFLTSALVSTSMVIEPLAANAGGLNQLGTSTNNAGVSNPSAKWGNPAPAGGRISNLTCDGVPGVDQSNIRQMNERRSPGDLTDILYHRHRETIALPPPDPEVVGQG